MEFYNSHAGNNSTANNISYGVFDGRLGQRNRTVPCRTFTSNGVPVASNDGECVCLHGCTVHVCDYVHV